jgi:prophage antirepressor-like protein
MNLTLARNELFQGREADFYQGDGTYFMTVEQLAFCLGYSNGRKGIDTLISRHNYLKDRDFSVTLSLKGTDGKSYNTRLFSEDGIYEVAFLSKTAVAQAFRAWVRKILKELRQTTLPALQDLTSQLEMNKADIEKIKGAVMELKNNARSTSTVTKIQSQAILQLDGRIPKLVHAIDDHADYLEQLATQVNTIRSGNAVPEIVNTVKDQLEQLATQVNTIRSGNAVLEIVNTVKDQLEQLKNQVTALSVIHQNPLKVKKELVLKELYTAFTDNQNEQYYVLKPQIGLAQDELLEILKECLEDMKNMTIKAIDELGKQKPRPFGGYNSAVKNNKAHILKKLCSAFRNVYRHGWNINKKAAV